MTIRALSFDIDGCLFHASYIYADKDKDVVTHNKPLLDKLNIENKAFNGVTVFVGSARQSYSLDKYNAETLDEGALSPRGSCFPAIKQLSNYLNAELDTFLLADLYGDLPEGTSYSRAMSEQESDEHAEYINDETKATILYAQMHKIAMAHPHEDIVFDFYDDKEQILDSLYIFFDTHKELIPKNVKLRVNYYDGEEAVSYETINGAGFIDTNFRRTVKDMAAVTTEAMGFSAEEVQEGRRIIASEYVTPELLTNRMQMTHLHIRLVSELMTVRKKAMELQSRGHFLAAQKAFALCNNLKHSSTQYFNGELDKEAFKTICYEEMKKARPELEKHRGWKEILVNLGIAIATLGIGYVVMGLYNLATKGDFILFKQKTDSAQKLDSVQHTLDQISSPIAVSA